MAKEFEFFFDGVFSNWHPSLFTIDGIEYNCCEQYMMAKKALMFHDLDAYHRIMTVSDPATQKDLGRKISGFNAEQWGRVCRNIVYDANLAKFSQNRDMGAVLIDTGDKELVEASPSDTIWGIGLSKDNPLALDKSAWKGTNWMGICLQEVRDGITGTIRWKRQ